jgi:hypothetical protein
LIREYADLDLPTREAIVALEKVHAQTRAKIAQLEHACVQIQRSITALHGQAHKPKAKPLIAEFFDHVTTALTPDEVYHAMLAQGMPIRKGSLYTTLRRMGITGELVHDKQANTYAALGSERHASRDEF